MAGYDKVRASVFATGRESRVEVNQRALIDKILARYASAGAVYRELIQNSNDATAACAEVRFVVAEGCVSEVVYRNNGLPFRSQDWERMRKIAEGNPDASKVGCFGVGAYTMFSICEEPLIMSGGQAMAFCWHGDALWAKVAEEGAVNDEWTTFVMPARDPYPPPDMVEFGQFLAATLTFTKHLRDIAVFVNDVRVLHIRKEQLGEPCCVRPPSTGSWWNRGADLTSPQGVFKLANSDGSITETDIRFTADIDGETAYIDARIVSASASVSVRGDMRRRIVRVTKKEPPAFVTVQVAVDAEPKKAKNGGKRARAILDSFSPKLGSGRIFIGFKTSQTTGLGAHVAAPLMPTVEREAIDLIDPTLRVYNGDLLFVCGILLRLELEHRMAKVGELWGEEAEERKILKAKAHAKAAASASHPGVQSTTADTDAQNGDSRAKGGSSVDSGGSGLFGFGFAKFMASGVKRIADVVKDVGIGDDEPDLLHPPDLQPLSKAERSCVVLMRCFSPAPATPEPAVGTFIANGFEGCLQSLSPPVLTRTGVARGVDCRLPRLGIERFAERNVVRALVVTNAESYLIHVANVRLLSIGDLTTELRNQDRIFTVDELAHFLKWWCRFTRAEPSCLRPNGPAPTLRRAISFATPITGDVSSLKASNSSEASGRLFLSQFDYYKTKGIPDEAPHPTNVIPRALQAKIPNRLLHNQAVAQWLAPLPFQIYADFVTQHPCVSEGRPEDAKARLLVLASLSKELNCKSGSERALYKNWLASSLGSKRCVPHEGGNGACDVIPGDLYMPNTDLSLFDGAEHALKKVCRSVRLAGVSEEFLLALNVRRTIEMNFLFSQLSTLKWNKNPQPLVRYLRSVSLRDEDMQKLRSTKYLPAANDSSGDVFAPSELCLPNADVLSLPFVRCLQWPSALNEESADAQFLLTLGLRAHPQLISIVREAADTQSADFRNKCIAFASKLLADGRYEAELRGNRYAIERARFLPASISQPLSNNQNVVENIVCSPLDGFSEPGCKVLGFAVIDLKHTAAAKLFNVKPSPSAHECIQQLFKQTTNAKSSSPDRDPNDIVQGFAAMFAYLSTRANEFDKKTRDFLRSAAFIPVLSGQGKLLFRRPSEVYFEDRLVSDVTASLFELVPYSVFLANAGVTGEPSVAELCKLVLSSPQNVLDKLGEARYRTVLRRIAHSDIQISKEMRSAPFLLGFKSEVEAIDIEDGDEGAETPGTGRHQVVHFKLTKPADVYVIDDAFIQRLFATHVLSAPQESDLEDFYRVCSSPFISKAVSRVNEVRGASAEESDETRLLSLRVRERLPLLVSSNITSRPVVADAALKLGENSLFVMQAQTIVAQYSLRGVDKSQSISSCVYTGRTAVNVLRQLTPSQKPPSNATVLFVTRGLDWYDVGAAVGSIMFERCTLADSFLIGSILESPLNQLRARGFPVDRMLKETRKLEPLQEEPQLQPIHPPIPAPAESKSAPASVPAGNSTSARATPSPSNGTGGFVDILQQMFPDCDRNHIKQLLDNDTSLDALRRVSNLLADGQYPKAPRKIEPSPAPPPQPPVRNMDSGPISQRSARKLGSGSGKLLSRALKGLRSGAGASLAEHKHKPVPQAGVAPRPGPSVSTGSFGSPSRPENDANNQEMLRHALRKSVRACTPVPAAGISSPGDQAIPVAPEAAQGSSCEVIPGHDLVPVSGGNGTSKTRNGLRVFATRASPESQAFLATNWALVERFSVVLSYLAEQVYGLNKATVAIFHDPGGRTIAFNAGKALHFNSRFFATLHDATGGVESIACMSYWYTVMAHELAHNCAGSEHGQLHGYFTESFATNYSVPFHNLLTSLGCK